MLSKGLLIILSAFLLCAFILRNSKDKLPSYLPQPYYKLPVTPAINDTVQLGRLLFYDNILSVNNQVSCASCHNSYNAFAHTDHDLSHGVFDSIGTRNAPGLFNLAWQKEFMWDGATHHIEAQALAPLHDPKELGSSIQELVTKLKASVFYQKEFFNTYKDSVINSSRALKAIAAFQLSIISFESKYDAVKKGEAEYSAEENAGYNLFDQHCGSCHAEPLFSSGEYLDNALPIDSLLNDRGRFLVTGLKEDLFKFKVPSLRNLSYTFPYMHDGRFLKLNDVLSHYNSIGSGNLKRNTDIKTPIELSFNERADLISFLLTLNDQNFVYNPAYSFPEKLKYAHLKN
tara:strand:+ start:5823 stop:6854 length:1032 start_codon:yes stop_codon:yes gene_type:complete